MVKEHKHEEAVAVLDLRSLRVGASTEVLHYVFEHDTLYSA